MVAKKRTAVKLKASDYVGLPNKASTRFSVLMRTEWTDDSVVSQNGVDKGVMTISN